MHAFRTLNWTTLCLDTDVAKTLLRMAANRQATPEPLTPVEAGALLAAAKAIRQATG
jgi:hypothetical protein